MKSLIKDICTPKFSWLFLLAGTLTVAAFNEYIPDPTLWDLIWFSPVILVMFVAVGVVEHILLTWSSK